MSIKKLYFKSNNKIGGVQISGTLTERHDHSAEVSTNTLETGVTVANHIHINPMQLTVEIIVTNTIASAIRVESFKNNTREQFNLLLELFHTREPFTINTGLKNYNNFVIKNISVNQDVNTANVLIARLELQEIIFVNSEFINIEVNNINSNDKSIVEQSKPVDEGRKK